MKSLDLARGLIDEALGELLAILRARGRWGNVLVIVTADHGELSETLGTLVARR